MRVAKGQLRLSHSTCPPLSSSPHAHSFVIGPAVINTHCRVPVQKLAYALDNESGTVVITKLKGKFIGICGSHRGITSGDDSETATRQIKKNKQLTWQKKKTATWQRAIPC